MRPKDASEQLHAHAKLWPDSTRSPNFVLSDKRERAPAVSTAGQTRNSETPGHFMNGGSIRPFRHGQKRISIIWQGRRYEKIKIITPYDLR